MGRKKISDELRVTVAEHNALVARVVAFKLPHVAAVASLAPWTVRRILKSSLPMKKFEYTMLQNACNALDVKYRELAEMNANLIQQAIDYDAQHRSEKA